MDFVEGGNAIVPFEQRGGVADAPDGVIVELPDGIDHRVIVSVQNIFAIFGMAGDVDLRDAISGDAVRRRSRDRNCDSAKRRRYC